MHDGMTTKPAVQRPALSLAQWSLHRRMIGERLPLAQRAARMVRGKLGMREPLHGDLDPLDFPLMARREFGFDAIDYIGYFYTPHVRDRSYLRELKRRCDGEGVQSLTISCTTEGEIGIGHPEANKRDAIAANHLRWMDMAAYLGCNAISVRVGSVGDAAEQLRLVADGLNAIADWANPHGLDVLVENHDGFSNDGAWLDELMRLADHRRIAMAPDWGNFGDDPAVRTAHLARVMPHARALTAKFFDFDEPGDEITMNVPALMRVVRDAGYRGPISVEYEGAQASECDGIRLSTAMLTRLLALEATPA